ncbi:MAG: hypothetical protein H0T39_14820 [Actinobacteria bacterium]|nr:hypothetical protein [Actinomycetota bacterium]
MTTEPRHEQLRSFVLGGLLGASAAIAAARRRRLPPRRRETVAGLSAFEGAPCYREAVERDEVDARTP